MTRYKVVDSQGVYADQVVDVPFDFRLQPLTDDAAKAMLVRILAIESMYGCAISSVDTKAALDTLRAVSITTI